MMILIYARLKRKALCTRNMLWITFLQTAWDMYACGWEWNVISRRDSGGRFYQSWNGRHREGLESMVEVYCSASEWQVMLDDVGMRCDDLEGDMIR